MELLKRSIMVVTFALSGLAVSACQTDGDIEPAGRAPAGEEGRAKEPGATGSTTESGAESSGTESGSGGGSRY